jgi:hypothetical protein
MRESAARAERGETSAAAPAAPRAWMNARRVVSGPDMPANDSMSVAAAERVMRVLALAITTTL